MIYHKKPSTAASNAALPDQTTEVEKLMGALESRERNIEMLVAENKRIFALLAEAVRPQAPIAQPVADVLALARAMHTAELLMRDDSRRAGDVDASVMHGDRAQVLTEFIAEAEAAQTQGETTPDGVIPSDGMNGKNIANRPKVSL